MTIIEETPELKGRVENLMKYTNYHETARQSDIQGRVRLHLL